MLTKHERETLNKLLGEYNKAEANLFNYVNPVGHGLTVLDRRKKQDLTLIVNQAHDNLVNYLNAITEK